MLFKLKLKLFSKKTRYEFFKDYPPKDIRKQLDIERMIRDKLEIIEISLTEEQKVSIYTMCNSIVSQQVNLTKDINESKFKKWARIVVLLVFNKYIFMYS